MNNRREQLLDAAQDIIQRRGYNAFSYQDLADVIRIRKASIHHHFPKKEDIGLALIQRYTESFKQILQNILAQHKNEREQFEAYCFLFGYTLTSSNHEKLCLGGIMGAESLTLPENICKAIEEFCDANETWLKAVIQSGMKNGVFTPTVHPVRAARMIFSSLEGAMMAARVEGTIQYVRDVIQQFRDVLYKKKKQYPPKTRRKHASPLSNGKRRSKALATD